MTAWLGGCSSSLNSELKSGLTTVPPAESAQSPVASNAQVASNSQVEKALSAQAPSLDALKAAATPGSNAYKIGNQDVLDISVFKLPEMSKPFQVSDSGSVSFPLLGEVKAAGRTTQELERELTGKLGAKYLQNPQVTVMVKEYNSQRVLLDGAVTKPGLYPVQGNSSLLQVIAQSGGLTPMADSTVVVFRTVDGKKSVAKFDVESIRSGQIQDPVVLTGDVVVASNSAMKDGFDKFLKLIPALGVFALL